MLCVLCGAGAVETVDENQIEGGCGPDCQCFHGPASGILYVTMVVYVEDAVTLLGSSLVTLTAGKADSLVLESGK